MNMESYDAMMAELRRINALGEPAEGKGAAIRIAGGCVSGVPYLFSSDLNNAFVFKNKEQANGFIDEFYDDLKSKNPQVIELVHD